MKEQLLSICQDSLKKMGLENDPRYKKRLRWEIDEIVAKEKIEYFLDLHQRKVRYPINQNNLLVCKLLGICKEHNIDEEPNCVYGEYPDIDTDFLGIVRDYLKIEWAPKTFGEEYVCNISNYTTFGIKSSLIDMARVHEESREEIQILTKDLEAKDDEGKVLTWDAAMRLYPELKKYCDDHPAVADAAKRLLHRNRGMGVHAGGLIISNRPLHDLVPLVKRKDNPHASAWVEGLHGQDLQPVGLVKFDLLVISNLMQIAKCCKLIKERKGLSGIANLPGQSDWTDVKKWRNDPESLAMADKGDLRCIFQFDSDGIRKLAIAGGVTCFEDLVAYASLFRPGPLGKKMHERYIERKRGRENYTLHPLIKPILEKTYGVMVFQEQVMKILNVVGNIPLKDCELVRKAISKKKIDQILEYKDMFIENGMINLSVNKEYMEEFFSQVESFSEYGFNLSVETGTLITTFNGTRLFYKPIEDFVRGDLVFSIDEYGKTVLTEVVNLHDHGFLFGYKVVFDDGYEITCSLDHKFLTEYGQKSLRDIIKNRYSVLSDSEMGSYGKRKFIDNSLRTIFSRQKIDERTSKKMSRLSTIEMESKEGWHYCGVQSSVWFGFRENEGMGFTSKKLRGVQSYKTSEYYCQKYQTKSIGITKKSIVSGCKKNFSKTRYSSKKSGTVASLERSKPRKICSYYRKYVEETKKIQTGALVAKPIGLGNGNNPVWRYEKASGFCEGKYLDRSRWILPFYGTKDYKKGQVISGGASKGCDVERRSEEIGRYYVDSSWHGLFYQVNKSSEAGMVGLASEHAEVTDTRRLVSRKILRVVPVGKRQMYDLEVANPTHNFVLPNGIVTSNSHAVAYTYISQRLLYLKRHFKHEFYAAILSCENESEKIKEYKIEAKVHGVDMHRLDINRSGITFDLVGDMIYFGFSHIKGIGEEPAKRIVAGQPYKDFEDFLARFGTESGVLKPLIGLRCFKDASPITLWKFCEFYKKVTKKYFEAKKRYALSLRKYQKKFEDLTETKVQLSDLSGKNPFVGPEWKHFDVYEDVVMNKEVECGPEDGGEERFVLTQHELEGTHELIGVLKKKYFKMGKGKRKFNRLKAVLALWGRYQRMIARIEATVLQPPKLSEFDPDNWEIDDSLIKEFRDPIKCEEKYYGFAWVHDLEKSPDYKGNLTFEQFRNDPSIRAAAVEIKILKVSKKQGKKVEFYQVECEDSTNCFAKFNVWMDDWERWGPELKKGNLVRVRLTPPSGGYPTYTFESPPRHMRWKLVPKLKDDDFRLVVLRPGKNLIDEELTHEEVLGEVFNDE